LRTLKTSEAAALLNVTPNTLRTWERRFGFPNPQRLPSRHRLYAYAEIVTLREALHSGLSISSAVSVASDAFGAQHALVGALGSYSAAEADEAMERSLALRSLERSVQEVLLPALDEVHCRKGPSSATWGFAATWANDWQRRALRYSSARSPRASLLIGDATHTDVAMDAVYTRAFALCCSCGGIAVLTLPVCGFHRLGEALAVLAPDVVVVAGGHCAEEEVGQWAGSLRSCAGQVPFLLYHRDIGHIRAPILPSKPREAGRVVVEMFA
jgi:MerR family transcriptional regulator, light-induced transcriptional regulator